MKCDRRRCFTVPRGLSSDDDVDTALIRMRATQFTTSGTLGLASRRVLA